MMNRTMRNMRERTVPPLVIWSWKSPAGANHPEIDAGADRCDREHEVGGHVVEHVEYVATSDSDMAERALRQRAHGAEHEQGQEYDQA